MASRWLVGSVKGSPSDLASPRWQRGERLGDGAQMYDEVSQQPFGSAHG
jgi:hypothetical protein